MTQKTVLVLGRARSVSHELRPHGAKPRRGWCWAPGGCARRARRRRGRSRSRRRGGRGRRLASRGRRRARRPGPGSRCRGASRRSRCCWPGSRCRRAGRGRWPVWRRRPRPGLRSPPGPGVGGGGQGVMAIASGKGPTLIGAPAELVAVLIGVTVLERALAT